jgi:transposase InsO family protein
LLEPIGNIPPAEAEENYYAMINNTKMAAWQELTCLQQTRCSSIWRQTWPTRCQAEATIFGDINGFYNARRRHSFLGGISLLAFEAKVA